MTHYTYTPQGVCSQEITFDIEAGKIHNLTFRGGCPGNLKAIARLFEGKDATEVATILAGNTCRDKQTSCADQLSQALKKALQEG